MVIKCCLFDIGGVAVGSPIVGVLAYERTHSLPPNYLNAAITAQGHQGAFQRLERSELPLHEFYELFGAQLSDVARGNAVYKRYCAKMGIAVPTLPTTLKIDGQELWQIMMAQALVPDPLVVDAIIRLRLSNKFKVAALTNNFVVPGAAPPAKTAFAGPITFASIQQSLLDSMSDPNSAGASTAMLKSLFHLYIESAVEGMRKPDPKFYLRALELLGVKAEETVFLDDIGINLVAARKLGIHTIRVLPGRSREAILELEELVGVSLLSGREAKL